MDFLADAYPWIKAGHVISVIAWMAALLYLPRLFVYHAGVAPDGPEAVLFRTMERRLAGAIMTPAMIAAWVFGLALVSTPGIIDWSADHWFHVKLTVVILLSALHGFLMGQMRALAEGRGNTPRFYRFLNEAPAVALVIIVVMVIVRPF